MQIRILVVSHDEVLRSSRSTLLLSAGYTVSAVASGDEAVDLIDKNFFDLVVIGRNSLAPTVPLDRRLRELYPHMPILKIAQHGEPSTPYPSQITGSDPAMVLLAVKKLLYASEGDNISQPPSHSFSTDRMP